MMARDALTVAKSAKYASIGLAELPAENRNAALNHLADALERSEQEILAANETDVRAAREAYAAERPSTSTLDRLTLDAHKLRSMARSVRAVAALDDPIGRVVYGSVLDDGLVVRQVTVPLGVVAAIFEARPDAATQITSLALKTGNAVVLKPGREAARTVRALVATLRTAIAAAGVDVDAVSLVEGRAAVNALLGAAEFIDLIVPRGSAAFVRDVMTRSQVPVLGHAAGVCHVYIDSAADVEMAVSIVLDAKTSYPAACNAVETVLIHAEIAERVLPPLVRALSTRGVEIRGCVLTHEILGPAPVAAANPNDWGSEFSDLVIACRIVDDLDAAITHINRHGSRHTDAIVTSDPGSAAHFLAQVDSASVIHNASTRFADGYRYGLGGEVGISTGKLHARGPVGLAGLTTTKWLVSGNGHVVAPYTADDPRPFLHRQLSVSRVYQCAVCDVESSV